MAADKTYKYVDLVGTSSRNFADAANNAVKRASQTLEGLGWFEVTELRGRIEGGKIAEYQASVRIAFRLMAPGELEEEGAAEAGGRRGRGR